MANFPSVLPIKAGVIVIVDLDTTVDYGVQQYGRYFARWVSEQARAHDLPEQFVMKALLHRFQARIKPEDESWFVEGLTPEEAEARLAELEETRDAIARSQESGWWA